jgi:tetratricopeptide (TPR) repeat protein
MTSIAPSFVSGFQAVRTPALRVPDSAAATREADKVLRVLAQLPDAALRGALGTAAGRILFADDAQADALMAQALQSDSAAEAVRLADEAYRMDPRPPSNGESLLEARAQVHWEAGKEAATRAWLLHDNAHRHVDAGLWTMAVEQYRAASAIDPVLAWSLNDAAWMAATSPDPAAHHGNFAVAMSVAACQARHWGNWSMIDTLAAAYARQGDFARAVSWQETALRLCRAQCPAKLEATRATLDHLRDGHPVIAGDAPVDASSAELAALARIARAIAAPFDTARNLLDVVADVEDAGLFHRHWGPPWRWSLDMLLGNFDAPTARLIVDRLTDGRIEGAICYRGIGNDGEPTGPAAAMFFGAELPLAEAQAAIDFEVRGPDAEWLPPIGLYRRMRDAAAAPTSPSIH